MSLRQVVLDTETTGLRVEDGHRIIEIGCIELIDRKITGQTFHTYINPEREVEAGAMAVHGITDDHLKSQPVFSIIVSDFMEFIKNSELIIHNAPFDTGFINNELGLLRQGWPALSDYCNIVDTLMLARQRHVGQRNSLDALCKRYAVDNSKRDLHGALMDAHLLAQVYLAMTGGQGNFFDAINAAQMPEQKQNIKTGHVLTDSHDLPVLLANGDELQEHSVYLEFLAKKGGCVWGTG